MLSKMQNRDDKTTNLVASDWHNLTIAYGRGGGRSSVHSFFLVLAALASGLRGD